jgi:hypothetical protein
MKSGLRQRPTFEGIVDYISNGQETVKYPDRLAKFMRNHPYLTQLDGEGMTEMQEQQENMWKEQEKEHRVKELSSRGTQSAPEVRAQMRAVDVQAGPEVRSQGAQSSTDVRTSEAQTMPEVRTQTREMRGMDSETSNFSFRTQLRREQAMTSNLQTFLLNQDRNIAEEMDTTEEEMRKRVREAEEKEGKNEPP